MRWIEEARARAQEQAQHVTNQNAESARQTAVRNTQDRVALETEQQKQWTVIRRYQPYVESVVQDLRSHGYKVEGPTPEYRGLVDPKYATDFGLIWKVTHKGNKSGVMYFYLSCPKNATGVSFSLSGAGRDFYASQEGGFLAALQNFLSPEIQSWEESMLADKRASKR